METITNKNAATLVHLSALSQYIIPFGNFIFPIIIWSATRKDSDFADNHGRQAINFQLSLFMYSLILCIIAIPIFIYSIFTHVNFMDMVNDRLPDDFELSIQNITGIAMIAIIAVAIFAIMKVVEFFLIIYASVKASYGEYYRYPFTINFIKEKKKLDPTFDQPVSSNESEATVFTE